MLKGFDMINALNGFNQSFNYQDTFNKQPTTIENLESQKEHMKSAHMVKNAAALEACKESQEVKIINFVSVKE